MKAFLTETVRLVLVAVYYYLHLCVLLICALLIIYLFCLYLSTEQLTQLETIYWDSISLLCILVIFYFPVSLLAATELEWANRQVYRRLGIPGIALNTDQKVELLLDCTFKEAFSQCLESASCLESVETFNHTDYQKCVSVEEADLQKGIIRMKTDFVCLTQQRQWFYLYRKKKVKGEIITFELAALSEQQVKVSIQSQSCMLFGLMDMGQNYLNIQRLNHYFKDQKISSSEFDSVLH